MRDHFASALAALAAATRDAAAGPEQAALLPPTTAAQGGESPAARRVTFMDAALALAPGLPLGDVAALAAAAAPGLTDRCPAIQKRAYKLLATVCAGRPDFLAEDRGADGAGLSNVLATLLAAGPRALPAAKRHRLAVVREAVLALRAQGGGGGSEGATPSAADAGATLIAEAVLATKEANRKTRSAAYDLLVDLGSPSSDPPGSPPGTGLRDLFAVVLGGLAGGSPHMVSASTMAAARLVHAYVPGPLGSDAGRLLPAILPLLRTPAREVIKSVLGFIKVCVGRLPTADLLAATPDLLDGLLRWSDDPKNKFRLKVRVIVERLARRIGFEAVAASMPASDAKLLAHIRKQGARKARKKAAGAEAEEEWSDGEGEGGRGRRVVGRRARPRRGAGPGRPGHRPPCSPPAPAAPASPRPARAVLRRLCVVAAQQPAPPPCPATGRARRTPSTCWAAARRARSRAGAGAARVALPAGGRPVLAPIAAARQTTTRMATSRRGGMAAWSSRSGPRRAPSGGGRPSTRAMMMMTTTARAAAAAAAGPPLAAAAPAPSVAPSRWAAGPPGRREAGQRPRPAPRPPPAAHTLAPASGRPRAARRGTCAGRAPRPSRTRTGPWTGPC